MVTPSRQAQAIEGTLEQSSHLPGGPAEAADLPRCHLAIRVQPRGVPITMSLFLPGPGHSTPDIVALGRPVRVAQLPEGNRRNRDVKIHTVH